MDIVDSINLYFAPHSLGIIIFLIYSVTEVTR